MKTLRPAISRRIALGLTIGLALATTKTLAAESATEPGAAAPALVMSAGAQGGGYWGIGSRLADASAAYGSPIEVHPSSGSLENLSRLADPDNPSALGLSQADALAVFLAERPDFVNALEVVESIGKECIFFITASDSGLDGFSDLSAGQRIAVPSPSSGVAVTFKALQSMQPHLANATAIYMDAEQAMEELGSPAAQRSIDALMLVHRPKLRSDALKQALLNAKQFHLLAIESDDLDLSGTLPNGQPVYTAMTLPLLRDGWNTRVSLPTLCTEGLLLTVPTKLSMAQGKALRRVVDFDWMQVYVEPRQ